MLPADMFVRPSGADGVVVFPNWLAAAGGGTYQVRIDFQPASLSR